MERPVVVIAIDPSRIEQMLPAAELERLRSFADVRVEQFSAPSTIEGRPQPDPVAEAALATAVADANALVVTHGAPRVSAHVLATSPELRFLGELEGDRFFGRIDVDAASERGVVVVDTTHGSSRPVAEFALASTILGLRDTWRYARRLRDGDEVAPTARSEPDRIANTELEGRTVGLIGFGHIGWRLAELLRPFHCNILVVDPFAPRELAEVADVTFATLDDAFANSDAVIALVPLTPGTTGMLGRAEFDRMRRGAVFVNVARGGVVDTAALIEAARRDEQVFCIDVLDPEPIPIGHPLRDLPNVLLTPHLAGATGQSRQRFFALMVDELERHFAGREPRAQVTTRVRDGRTSRKEAQ